MSGKASRAAFGEAIVDLGAEDSRVVVVDADLSKSTMTGAFAERFPERYFDIGIAEGNMVGVGAGLALGGKVPFICSFGCFIVGRFEQIRISVAYSRTNVKIVGTHVGIGIGEDGYSQMGLEDMALIRSLPNIPVIQPADEVETKQAIRYAVRHDGPLYLRLTRQKLEPVHANGYTFAFGKGDRLRDGGDLTIIATGGVVHPALQAAELLEKEGIRAGVINIATVKPLDRELVLQAARETGRLLTVEDHSVTGGLGDAVCEVVCDAAPVRVRKVGVRDFGESGPQPELYVKFGICAEGIARQAAALARQR